MQSTSTKRPIPGYSTQSSLVAPWDITEKKRNPLNSTHPPLSDEEFLKAFNDLYVDNKKVYPSIERRFADPPIPYQRFVNISFIPTRGARPDKEGVYGMVKVRGCYDTEREASDRVEDLIRNHDSYHKIYTGRVGIPMPLTLADGKFSNAQEEIDVHKKISEEISATVKAKRDEERKEVETIQNRAKNLQSEVDKEGTDPETRYIDLRNKKAQLIYTYVKTREQLQTFKESIIKTFKEIKETDETNPEYRRTYFKKFIEARKSVGIKDVKLKDTFMEYLVEDKVEHLDFEIPQEYISSPLPENLEEYREYLEEVEGVERTPTIDAV